MNLFHTLGKKKPWRPFTSFDNFILSIWITVTSGLLVWSACSYLVQPLPQVHPPSTPQLQINSEKTTERLPASGISGRFSACKCAQCETRGLFFSFALICIFNTLPQALSHLVPTGAGVMMSHFRRTKTACCFLCFICWPTVLIYCTSSWFYLHMKCWEHFNLLAMNNDS